MANQTMFGEVYVVKLGITGEIPDQVILRTAWRGGVCDITLVYKDEVWCGEVTETMVQGFVTRLQMEETEYLVMLKNSLTNPQMSDDFIYSIDTEERSFTWEKRFDGETSFLIGQISIDRAAAEDRVLRDLLTYLVDINYALNRDLSSIILEKKQIEIELKKTVNLLEELNKMKNEMESNLYSQFLILLNEKKRKLAELKESKETVTQGN